MTKDIDQSMAEGQTRKWFTNARDRDGNRALRAQLAAQRALANRVANAHATETLGISQGHSGSAGDHMD